MEDITNTTKQVTFSPEYDRDGDLVGPTSEMHVGNVVDSRRLRCAIDAADRAAG